MSSATFVPSMSSLLRPGSRRIAGANGVLADHYVVDGDKSSHHVTRVAKHSALAGELRLDICAQSVAAKRESVEGMAVVPLPDAEFCEAFRVWSNDPERAQVWLDDENRSALMMTNGYAFVLDDGEFVAECKGLELHPRRLFHVMAAVACFGRTAERLRRHWLRVAEPQQGDRMAQAAGIAGYRVEHEGIAVEVSHAGEQSGMLGRRGYTEMRARRLESATDRFVIRKEAMQSESRQPMSLRDAKARSLAAYRIASSQPDEAGLRFTCQAQGRLDLVEPTRIEAGQEWVTLRMDGTAFEAERMNAALELVASLARPSTEGP